MSKDAEAVWRGWLKRGTEPETVIGELTDHWGWTITLVGKRDAAAGGYALEGRLGEVPAALRVPAIDDEK